MVLPLRQLAREAGCDGVEVMGSEGYLINEFSPRAPASVTTTVGGDYARRMRFAVEAAGGTANGLATISLLSTGPSMPADSVNDAAVRCRKWIELAQAIEAAGATLINTGIGWHGHEPIPTIATPGTARRLSWVTRLKGAVDPRSLANRINDPDVADAIRPRRRRYIDNGLAASEPTAEFLSKPQSGRADEINTCIGCHQPASDQIFAGKVTSCLVNLRLCHETLMPVTPAVGPSALAVVGAGLMRLGLCRKCRRRLTGHPLFDASSRRLAGSLISPNRSLGKERVLLKRCATTGACWICDGVNLQLGQRVTADRLLDFDETIRHRDRPRMPEIAVE